MENLTKKLQEEYENSNLHTEALMIELIEASRFDLLEELSKLAQVVKGQSEGITEEQYKQRIKINDCLLLGITLDQYV